MNAVIGSVGFLLFFEFFVRVVNRREEQIAEQEQLRELRGSSDCELGASCEGAGRAGPFPRGKSGAGGGAARVGERESTSVLVARVFMHAVLSVGPERRCNGG